MSTRSFTETIAMRLVRVRVMVGAKRPNQFLLLRRKTRRDRMPARLLAIQEGLRRRLHTTGEEQGDWLRQVVSAVAGAAMRAAQTWMAGPSKTLALLP
jgi:hypothetical protein